MQPPAPADAAQHELHDDETGRLSLQQLPKPVLELIVVALKHQEHQQALRCTCSAMRVVVDGLIDHLRVGIDLKPLLFEQKPQRASCKAYQQNANSMMLRFPAGAVVRRLTWKCMSLRPRDDQPYLVLSVLSTFLMTHESRFVHVRCVTLSGDVAFSCGDAALLASTCPHLSSITFEEIPLCGPVLWGLTSLTNLSSLRLDKVHTPHGAEVVTLALPRLHHLTSLGVTDQITDCYDEDYKLWQDDDQLVELSEEDAQYWSIGGLEDYERIEQARRDYATARLGGHLLMPYLTALTKLQSLELTLGWPSKDVDRLDRFHPLSALTGLTRLVLSHDIGMPEYRRNVLKLFTWTRDHLAFIPSLRHLASLRFTSHHRLDVDALRLLAMAPCLTELEFNPVGTDVELSRLPVAWQRLTLPHCTLDQLLRLPLSNVTCLATNEVDFSLTGPDASHASKRIQEAAELLAMRWPACAWQGKKYQQLRLKWELGPSQAPSAPTHSVLAALAPLGSACNPAASRLHVILEGEAWEVGEQHVQLLNQHLPQLSELTVIHVGPSFVDALAALADGALLQLRELHLEKQRDPPMPIRGTEAGQRVCEGLLALLKARCDLGLPLHVWGSSCLTSEQIMHCRQELQQHMKAANVLSAWWLS